MRVYCCPACHSENFNEFLRLDTERLARFIDYSERFYGGLLSTWLTDFDPILMKCGSCSHVCYGVMPNFEQLSEMYRSVRRSANAPDPARPPSLDMVKQMESLYSVVQSTAPTLLDFGAGYGRWSQAAFQSGFSVVSYEPHAMRSVQNGKYQVVHDRDQLDGCVFDVIWLEQVLEHVVDPLSILEDIRSFMSPTTMLCLSVPNIERCREGPDIWKLWPFDGVRSHTLAPFQHLHGFSQRSLNALVYKAGLKRLQGLNIWRLDPTHQLRVAIGMSVPRLSTTRCYLTLR